MGRVQGWIKVDRRLHEHWKVRRIASATGVSRIAIVGCMVYLWGYADDCGPNLGPHFSEADHELPPGIVDALLEVGWAARLDDGSVLLSTRDDAESARMSAVARARYDRTADAVRTQSTRSAGAVRRRVEREKRREEIERAATPPAVEPPASPHPHPAAVIREMMRTGVTP